MEHHRWSPLNQLLSTYRSYRLGGLIVAIVGFSITRLFVAEALDMDATISFVFGGIGPLIVGLCLTIFGVILMVGPFDDQYANTVAFWCVVGTGVMVVVLAVTAFDAILYGASLIYILEPRLLTANVLLGGAIGGTITGILSAEKKKQQLAIQASDQRARVVNRLLRHEVINAVAIVDGHAEVITSNDTPDPAAGQVIREAASRITATIKEVGRLTDVRDRQEPVDIAERYHHCMESLRDRYPAVSIEYRGPSAGVAIPADHRVDFVLTELVTNAACHMETSKVVVDLQENDHNVRLTVSDDGRGLPEAQRALLTEKKYPEFDDPTAGFGLQLLRLLVTEYAGDIAVSTDLDGGGTSVHVAFPKDAQGAFSSVVLVAFPNIIRAIGVGLIAGVVMGAYFTAMTDTLPIIGSLYGIEDPLVGWVTHLFHSVVFALLFAAAVTHSVIAPYARSLVGCMGIAVMWGLFLWLVAAGIIMPLWLNIVGIEAAIPLLTEQGLISHLLWGGTLGATYHLLPDRTLTNMRS